MLFHTQEILLDLPEVSQDRTINVLSLHEPQQNTPCQLVINRDVLLGNETLAQCVERQIGIIKRQTQSFKLISQQPAKLGAAEIDAVLLESKFIQASKTFYQLQALFTIEPPKLLAVTLSSQFPLHEGHHALWMQTLGNMVIRSTND